MPNSHDDEKAFKVLEEAVHKAQESLEKTKHFQPFLMLLNDAGKIEVFENEITNSTKSYAMLEKILKESIKMGDVDVMVLAVDTVIPENFVEDIPHGIRLHLEEKSQIDEKISARFLYVPYELCKVENGEMYVKLHAPIAVGFPAEYIVK
jgi:peptide subunit release factor 1 (eRF1)